MADSILLLPAPEHREALLDDSPGGGKVPIRRIAIGPWSSLWTLADSADVQWNEPDRPYDDFDAALVLRWRGVDDPMGCARAAAVMGVMVVGAVTTSEWSDSDGLGRVVHLDADGREVIDG